MIDADKLKNMKFSCAMHDDDYIMYAPIREVRENIDKAQTISTERLAKATADAENWMSKAPYLCYDLAKELIAAAKEVAHANA